jgi:hypothetical protein
MEPDSSLLCSKDPVTGLYPQMNIIHILPPYFLKIYLVLSSHLRLGLPSDIFPSVYPTKILYVFLISPMCRLTTCPVRLPRFNRYNNIYWIV